MKSFPKSCAHLRIYTGRRSSRALHVELYENEDIMNFHGKGKVVPVLN